MRPLVVSSAEGQRADNDRNGRASLPIANHSHHWGEAEDLAALAMCLASPVARYITGTVIPVNGGLRRYQF